MSAYTTERITRAQAEKLVQQCRQKDDRSVKALTDEQLDAELHAYVYAGKHTDIVRVLTNYIFEPERS